MQITIVGAGIGGLGVALALARSGHSVRVLERAPNLAEVGAGIQVSANGCRVLQRWGLLDNLLEKADAAAYGFFGNGLTGRALCKYPLSAYSESHYQLPHLQVHRADLLDTILHACNQTEGVEIFTDAQVYYIHQDKSSVICRTEQGGEYPSDLLIGADGMRSRVAELVFSRAPAKFTGKVAWRALIDISEINSSLDIGIPGIWTAPGKHLVHYPIRQASLLNIVACADSSERVLASWDNRCSTDQFVETFGDFAERLRDVIAPLQESYIWGLYETEEHPWVKDRVMLLGDAAHAMLPSMAQGAVMALEDAAVFEQLLSSGKELDWVLGNYQRMRKSRASAVQHTARENIEIFHAPAGVMRSLRELGLSLLGDRAEDIIGRRYDWIYGADPISEAAKIAAA
jgi:salicylate hydroxylase